MMRHDLWQDDHVERERVARTRPRSPTIPLKRKALNPAPERRSPRNPFLRSATVSRPAVVAPTGAATALAK